MGIRVSVSELQRCRSSISSRVRLQFMFVVRLASGELFTHFHGKVQSEKVRKNHLRTLIVIFLNLVCFLFFSIMFAIIK